MAFTGKATYSAGVTLPELCEDVSDVIGIVSPYETPLLNLLGDPITEAGSTYHEWLEDTLLSNKLKVTDDSISDPLTEMMFTVDASTLVKAGDQLQAEGSRELIFVVEVLGSNISVDRGYAGTNPEAVTNGTVLNILGGAALEGAAKDPVRFTSRRRCGNYTQIFTSTVEVSGSNMSVRHNGIANEMDYQKQERLRELLRDLENCVVNGGQASSTPQGNASSRRTMKGIIPHIVTNAYTVGDANVPEGNDLDEEKISFVLRNIWENSNAGIDTILVNGYQKRQINKILDGSRMYMAEDNTFSSMVTYFESDYGMCKVVLSRWVPRDMVLFLDSSRISVLPLQGRSFHFKSLASGGDFECGQMIGEYTLELKNEQAHGYLRGLSVG